jgi:hypothetical protein
MLMGQGEGAQALVVVTEGGSDVPKVKAPQQSSPSLQDEVLVQPSPASSEDPLEEAPGVPLELPPVDPPLEPVAPSPPSSPLPLLLLVDPLELHAAIMAAVMVPAPIVIIRFFI